MSSNDRHVERVLVIAPHPDDDAIGCGGTLARLAASGSRIDVTYVTDGSRSHRSQRFPPTVLRDLREDEARTALACLGVSFEPQFLRAPDGGLSDLEPWQRRKIMGEVARRIGTTDAEVVFAPWIRDPHPDHVATAAIVGDALERVAQPPEIVWYSVWLPIRGHETERARLGEASPFAVSLSERELDRKRAAIMAHRSQTTALIDDDPAAFRIDGAMLALWLKPMERFYRRVQR